MDKSREQFEEWMKAYWFEPNLSTDKYGYENQVTSEQWQAWQASRAALVVELTAETYFSPCKTELELAHDDGFNSAMKDVKAALDMAGVKYE